ncbi:MAG: DUF4363 family protein [Romboutsia sp.]
MKSLISVIIWSIVFIVGGLYINSEIYNFTDKYTSRIELIGKHMENDDWDIAKENLDIFYEKWHEEKDGWYKLLNHEYFDCICLDINILYKNISVRDKSRALEEVEVIKMTLSNILESTKCDFNHIF